MDGSCWQSRGIGEVNPFDVEIISGWNFSHLIIFYNRILWRGGTVA